jgi:hypothetical protein
MAVDVLDQTDVPVSMDLQEEGAKQVIICCCFKTELW